MEEKFMVEQSQKEIEAACELARELHQDQVRKGTKIPYFEHLAEVALLVKNAGGSNNQVIAAFLHDSLEDQPGKINSKVIEEKFGHTVAQIVMSCTDDKSIQDWDARKREKLERVSHPLSYLVTLCDKLHNAESIIHDFQMCGDQVWERFRKGKAGTLWWYQENLRLFKKKFKFDDPMLKRYERAVFLLEKIAERGEDK